MKSLATVFVFVVALASPQSHAKTADPSLLGCWRAVKIVQYFKDGSKAEDSSGRCSLQYKDDQLVSSCASAAGTVTSTYRLRIERPDFYLATMTGSTFRTSLLGGTREYQYHADGEKLTTAIDLQVAEPAAATAMVRVETTAARMACH
jgi:hypothetical protein